MPRPQSVYGKDASILITGASSGIGAALAEHLGAFGGKIALVARRQDRLQEVAGRVQAQGAQALVLATDVTEPQAVHRAYDEVVAKQGPVDVAFLNAGAGRFISLRRFDAQRIRRLFEVNVFGVLYWMEALLPEMIRRRKGILAVTSSVMAGRSVPGTSAYSSTKAAVSSLIEGYRPEAKLHNVQLSLIEPGFVRSEMTKKNPFPMPTPLDSRLSLR